MATQFESSPFAVTSALPASDGDRESGLTPRQRKTLRASSAMRPSPAAPSPAPTGGAASAAASPSPASASASFDFSSTALSALHTQGEVERISHTPHQQQFVAGILHPPQRSAPRTIEADHSSFLIQDRIHFFERYAVQPRAARRGPTLGATLGADASTARPAQASEHKFSRGVAAQTRLGVDQPSTTIPERSPRSHHPRPQASPAKQHSDALLASSRGGAHIPPPSPHIPNPVGAQRPPPPPQPQPIFGSTASRFGPDLASPKHQARPSPSHAQWGHAPDLPPFFDQASARSFMPAPSKSQALTELVEPEARLNSTVPNGLGGYILESDHSHPSKSSRHLRLMSAALSGDGPDGQAVTSPRSSGDSGTLTMGEHCRLVNEALAQKTAELLSAYRAQVGAEQMSSMADGAVHAHSADRAELSRVVAGYQAKLQDVSAQFDSLQDTQARTHALQLSNASLRVFNLELARNYDAELQDMKLEIELLQVQNAPPPVATAQATPGTTGTTGSSSVSASLSTAAGLAALHAGPLAQIHALEKHVTAKEAERARLEAEIAEVRAQVAQQRPYLAAQLATTLDRAARTHESLRTFAGRKEQAHAQQRESIETLRGQIASKLQARVQLQSTVDALKSEAGTVRGKMAAAENTLRETRAAYEAEVTKGQRELMTLQSSLLNKSSAFDSHYLLLQSATELAAAIESKVKIDLLCRTCMQLLKNPMILWPCGHTLCERCVTKRELDGSPLKPVSTTAVVAAKKRGSATTPTTTATTPTAFGPGGGYLIICTECQSNFDHPLSRAEEEADAAEEISFPNPFFDRPANFEGRFYMVPNVHVGKLVDAYHSCSARLSGMLPQLRSLTRSADVFSGYLAEAKVGAQGTTAATTRLQLLPSEEEAKQAASSVRPNGARY